ncbi:MAG: choice-of-anchor D domain-containing protein, partial [Candidatus Cloacimonetes bacterium]|nr:choice-of-anchor D domain-containing protein [Candidatus Cloacimonadota bacterium]
NASASIGINMSPGGTGWFYSITPGTVPIASTTAENTSVSIYPNNGTVYEFLPTVASPNDLQALSILGNTTPSVNTPTNYVVSVRNRGTNPQTTYQVQIVTSTGTVLASVTGQAIQPNQVIEYTIPWTPTTEGPVILRGKTILAGDANPTNDQSPPLNVTVMPEGMVVVTIGDGNEIGNVPVDMFWCNSLFETIYYPQEIGMVGNITALTFYNSFTSTLPNQAIKIWLGTTQMENLSANWIPSTQMTLVYDGTVNYSSGVNPVLIPLQTVYTYTGGNLVMMVNRPMDTQYYSSEDRFQVQTVGTNRSREIHADGTTYDPANPPDSPTISGIFPKTSIHMTPLGTDPIAMINPSEWNVGTVLMNTTFNRSISVINGGGGTLTLSSVSISGSPFFTLPNLPALPVTLVTGQSYAFTAHYAPTEAGNHSATITLVDNLTRQTYQIPLTATALDPTIYTLPYAQYFDAVTAPALPVDWTSIVTTTMGAYLRSTTNNPYSAPNCIEMYNTGDAASTLMLISPPYANDLPVNTSRVNFRGKANTTTATVQIGFMTDSQNAATFQLIDTVALTTNWTEYVISFAAYTGAGRYLAFKHGNSSQYETVYIDNVMIEVIPQNDLAAIAIAGNTTPSVDSQVFYTVSVYNWGSNPQSNYQVKLFDANDVELSSVAGTTVAPATTAEVQIPWTPLVQGPTSIYGKVVLTGDQNSLNDASPMLGVTVMPEGMMVITVGSGNEQSRVPVDMYWMNSLFETLYYPTELGVLGTITALSFYNNFSTNLPNKPTKIWLGSTQLEDLSGGWIPSSQLTLVFDGTVNYPSGENTITIPLQNPFPYTGGNLVMMVNRPMDTTYFSSLDNFYAQTVGNNRALRVQADGTTYDPANPPTGITPTGQFPKTAFHMTPIGPDPIYLVTPTGRNFGTVLQNTTHNQNFTVMNVGGGTLNISSINITGLEYMTLQNLPVLPASLNTGQSITFTGRYNPTAVGNHTA